MTYLYPGELVVSAEPRIVSTVVGSCVSVFLWDARRKQGGMNHYLLPQSPRSDEQSTRFGNAAIRALLDKLARLGSEPPALVAKIFGGAHVLHGPPRDPNHLGHQNIALALTLLQESHVPILAADIGGVRGRRVVVHTDDGSAWVKEL